MGIFDRRLNYKPFEYPSVQKFIDVVNQTFWVHSEIDFTADIQDFKSELQPHEQNAVKNSLLAIAQIEVSVKTFWGDLYRHLPKPEFNGLGSTFAECEYRHSEAYSRLITVLGYEDDFLKAIATPALRSRIDYLNEALQHTRAEDHKQYVASLLLFSMLIENVSLFSQFATILCFNRFKGLMKNVANIIQWTSVDELIHANAGLYLIFEIKKEHPELFDDQNLNFIYAMIHKSLEMEAKILDWIFEMGPVENVAKEDLLLFMKMRVDEALTKIGLPEAFGIKTGGSRPLYWFEEEIYAPNLMDFFVSNPTDYSKHKEPITPTTIFDNN